MPLSRPVTDATLVTSDITTNDASASKHGFLKKLSGVATEAMGGDGNWFTPAGTGAVATDAIWDAKGDLAGGTGANTAQRLAVGTNNYVLTAASGETTGLKWALPIGAWTDYTPSLTASVTNPTLGSSTVAGRYKALDATTYMLIIEFNVTTGGAWNPGSGTYAFSIPAGLTAARRQIVAAHLNDSGALRYVGTAVIGSGGSTISVIHVVNDSGGGTVAATVPVTWATGDYLVLQGLIEVA